MPDSVPADRFVQPTSAALQSEQDALLEILRLDRRAHLTTDATLLARAVEWAAATPECAGEIYNITNGDVVAWRDWFPRIAAHFDVPLGEPQPLSLVREMPGHVDTWRKLAAREALRCEDLDALIGLSWQYADMIWANPSAQPRPALVSSIKARQHGFGHCVDSEDALIEVFELMQEQGYLPR